MDLRIASLLMTAVLAAVAVPAPARALDVANGIISIENPTAHAIRVTITGEEGPIETLAIGAYRRGFANRCCYRAQHHYGMSAVYENRSDAIASTHVFLWHCPRNGHTYGYMRVILSTASGRPALVPVHDGSCYSGG
jgi:hypothetical protein